MTRTAWMCSLAFAVLGSGTLNAAEAPTSSEAQEQARTAAITAALARAAGAKMAVEAYHIAQRKFPSNNAEVNLGAPDTYASGSLKRLQLQGDGDIQLVLGPDSGINDGTILLHPQRSTTGDENALEWTCISPSYVRIGDMTGGACAYQKKG